MSLIRRTSFVVAVTCLTLGAAAASRAGDPAADCAAAKLKAAGKYASCLHAANAKSLKSGDPVDTSKCIGKFSSSWTKAESKGGCRTSGDEGLFQADIEESASISLRKLTITACCSGSDGVSGACGILSGAQTLSDCQMAAGPLATYITSGNGCGSDGFCSATPTPGGCCQTPSGCVAGPSADSQVKCEGYTGEWLPALTCGVGGFCE